VPEVKEYKTGETYLFLLWDRHEEHNPGYAVATFIQERGCRFVVKDNILYDDYNYFGFGTAVNWSIFKASLNNVIAQILNCGDY